MKQVDAILDKITLPEIHFQSKDVRDDFILFEEQDAKVIVDGDDVLSQAIATIIARCVTIEMSYGNYKYTINRSQVYNTINQAVRDFHIQLWMVVNGKTEFGRTKLKKDLGFAHSDKFRNLCLELFLDAAKYGITRNTLNKNMQIKPIHKFIALKFQAMVEAECPR